MTDPERPTRRLRRPAARGPVDVADPHRADSARAGSARADPHRAGLHRVDSPRADSPRADSPRADSPRADSPRADSPRADSPRPDADGADAPTVRSRRPRSGGRSAPAPVRTGRGWVFRLVVGALLVAALIVGGTAFRVWQVARVDDRRAVDAVVVLGAAQYDGEPSSIFSWRLRHAQVLYEEGIAPRIVTTGGGQAGDATTEAEAGRAYLIDRGVPADAVIAIGEGSDTLGSVAAVAARAEADGWNSALLVSDPWHSLRARTMARDAGLDAWTSPTRSGPVVQTRETQVRYILRETAALLFYRLTHASVDEVA